MEQSIHLPTKGSVRIHHKKDTPEVGLAITKASFIAGKKMLVNFSNGVSKMVDFEPLFKKYVKGAFSYFADPIQFKKFKVAGGNLFWGENEDVIFSAQTLIDSRYSKLVVEEILYVI